MPARDRGAATAELVMVRSPVRGLLTATRYVMVADSEGFRAPDQLITSAE